MLVIVTMRRLDRALQQLWKNVKDAISGVTKDLTSKQDKSDSSLQTTAKTVVGAINELLAIKAPSSHSHTLSDITDLSRLSIYIETDGQDEAYMSEPYYVNQIVSKYGFKNGDWTVGKNSGCLWVYMDGSFTNLQVKLANKQDATSDTLNTTDKTIVGAINELLAIKAPSSHSHTLSDITDLSRLSIYIETDGQDEAYMSEPYYVNQIVSKYGFKNGDWTVGKNSGCLWVYMDGSFTNLQVKLANKQDATSDTLNTTDKTIVGAINEVNTKANNIEKNIGNEDMYAEHAKTIKSAIAEINYWKGNASQDIEHAIGDIKELQASVNSKQPIGDYAQAQHTHVFADITDVSILPDNDAQIIIPIDDDILTSIVNQTYSPEDTAMFSGHSEYPPLSDEEVTRLVDLTIETYRQAINLNN